MRVIVGIDVGQKVDPTAIAVCEQQWRVATERLRRLEIPMLDHYVVRYLDRLDLGTSYPDITERLQEVIQNLRKLVYEGTLKRDVGDLRPDDEPSVTVYVDATGVGQPVVDELRAAGEFVTGVIIRGGDQRLEVRHPTTKQIEIKLGKAYMVSRMQALMQSERLHIISTMHGKALGKELLDYEIKIDRDANEQFGAFRTGAHDDLVTAVGLCVQETQLFIGGAVSTEGHVSQAVPEWAGGYTNARGGIPGPRLGQPDIPGLFGSNDPFRGY